MFWSIAELFQRPYQPLVWSCIGVTLVATCISLAVFKVFGQITFSLPRLMFHIAFNLVEIGVSPGNILKNHSGLKLLLAAWFLMGIILTNSYKGLIISYLIAPWAPHQEFNYFSQILDFKFYSPIIITQEEFYWRHCKNRTREECNFPNSDLSSIVGYIAFSAQELHVNGSKTFTGLVAYDTYLFPRNETKEMLQELAKGGKVAVVGLNTEIDEFLTRASAEFKRITFFEERRIFGIITKIGSSPQPATVNPGWS